nr:T9SS type A sorting domain-containing protein [Ignavibacteria bacterium]
YFETAYSIKKLNNNEYVFCGTSDSVKEYYERAFIRKIDLSGNVLSEKFYRGGDESNQFSSIDLTNDKGYILCGYATFITSALYSYIVKTDSLGNIPTKINNSISSIIENYKLYQNYPNPFNPLTLIKYYIPVSSKVKITIFDILGKEILTLTNKLHLAGNYKIEFNSNLIKDRISSGIYFYKLATGDFTAVKRMVLIK